MSEASHAPFALIVDDEPLIRMSTANMLAEAGFRPLEACQVVEALMTLEEHAGDVRLLLTDVQMPGERDGFALAREVSRRWPDIGILVASGAMRPGSGDLPAGAVFVSKPFGAAIFRRRLDELLPDARWPEPSERSVPD